MFSSLDRPLTKKHQVQNTKCQLKFFIVSIRKKAIFFPFQIEMTTKNFRLTVWFLATYDPMERTLHNCYRPLLMPYLKTKTFFLIHLALECNGRMELQKVVCLPSVFQCRLHPTIHGHPFFPQILPIQRCKIHMILLRSTVC